MTMTDSEQEGRALDRARRSIRCLPFRRYFYQEVGENAMNSRELVERVDWERLVFAPFGRERAEEHFEWMIKLGILRREVDGQGLTNKIRLTPLGARVISEWEGEIPRSGLRERIRENFFRHGVKV